MMNMTHADGSHQGYEKSMFNAAFEIAVIGMALVDPQGRMVAVNRAFARMLGYGIDEMQNVNFGRITHPDDIDADMAQFDRVLKGEIESYSMEKRYLRKNGSIAHGVLSVAVMRDAHGEVELFVSQIVDITERRLVEEELAKANAKMSLAMGMMECGVWQYDLASGQFSPSEQFVRMVGGPGALAADCLDGACLVDEADAPIGPLAAFIASDSEREVTECRIRIHDRTIRWFRCHRQVLRDEDGRADQIIGSLLDITDERAQVSRLETKASTDALTGLLNRRGMNGYIKTIKAADLSGIGIIMLDLDHFKQANDAYGHAAGDAILAETGRRLRNLLRADDGVIRLGGDEFAIILRNTDARNIQRIVERVLKGMMGAHAYDDTIISIGASAGVAVGSRGDTSIDDIIKRADAALYQAKQQGRNKWRWAA